ncbi:hypothetical protein WJX72_005844 [[Myrmecia] bisecta]|uniref:Uncharacterized protein n=1 Tax=[Myrmecia] bisecta TaxID=41462 RepID=A0AAW1R6P5_9CHLO
MEDPLQKVRAAFAEESLKDHPDESKLQRLKDAVATLGASAAGASNTQWDTAGLCDDLSLFAKACQVPEVQEQILELRPASTISLGNGALWLGLRRVATPELFVRPCYIALLEAREQYLKSRDFQDRPGTTIFTGTPGIGKSHLGGVVVGKALVVGRPVLLEIVSPDKEVHKQRSWYWILPTGDVECTDNAMMGNERLKEAANAGMDPLYVVDGGVPSLDENLWANNVQGHVG